MSDLSDPASSQWWIPLGIAGALGVLSYLATVLRLRKVDLVDALLAQEGRSDTATRRLVRRQAEYQAAYLLFQVIGMVALVWSALALNLPGGLAGAYAALLLLAVELTVRRLVPQEGNGRSLRVAVAVARLLYWLTVPLSWPLARSGAFRVAGTRNDYLERAEDVLTPEEEESPAAPEPSARNGERSTIDAQERAMIYRILEFPDTRVDEVMVPRTDMTCLEINTPFSECLRVIQETRYSRIPVYEGTIDNIVGILHLKDLIGLWGQEEVSLAEIIHRPAFVVPESKRINELFAEFRRQRQHMAIVLDEYGGTKGLVTLEDLLEEIVGDIWDEFDREEREIVPIDERTYEVNARMHLSDLNEMLELDLPEDSANTLGGLLVELSGRVPKPGEVISYEDRLVFRVIEADSRRVRKVRMQILPRGEAPSDENA